MLKVLNEKVLVKVTREDTVTAGGLIIPDSAGQERKYEGYVVGVGTHPDIAAYGVKKGVYVYYPKGLNTEFKQHEDGRDIIYDVVSIYDILAIGVEE